MRRKKVESYEDECDAAPQPIQVPTTAGPAAAPPAARPVAPPPVRPAAARVLGYPSSAQPVSVDGSAVAAAAAPAVGTAPAAAPAARPAAAPLRSAGSGSSEVLSNASRRSSGVPPMPAPASVPRQGSVPRPQVAAGAAATAAVAPPSAPTPAAAPPVAVPTGGVYQEQLPAPAGREDLSRQERQGSGSPISRPLHRLAQHFVHLPAVSNPVSQTHGEAQVRPQAQPAMRPQQQLQGHLQTLPALHPHQPPVPLVVSQPQQPPPPQPPATIAAALAARPAVLDAAAPTPPRAAPAPALDSRDEEGLPAAVSFSTATAPLFGGAAEGAGEAGEEDSWLGMGLGPRQPDRPTLQQAKFRLSVSSSGTSPHVLVGDDKDRDSNSSVSLGFGSVMMCGGSEASSRRNSLLPRQVSLAMAAAAEALAAAEEEEGQSADGAESAPPPAPSLLMPPFAASPTAALSTVAEHHHEGEEAHSLPAHAPASAPAAAPSAVVEAATELGPLAGQRAEAEADAAWVAPEPATTFQVLARPMFGSLDVGAATFDDFGTTPHAFSPSSSFFDEGSGLGQAGAGQVDAWGAEQLLQATAWEQEPAAVHWQAEQQAATWEQPEQAAPAAAPWEQPEHQLAVSWEQPEQLPSASAPWEHPEQLPPASAPWEQSEHRETAPWVQRVQSEQPAAAAAAAVLWEQQEEQAAGPWSQPEQQQQHVAAPWEQVTHSAQGAAPWEEPQQEAVAPSDQPQLPAAEAAPWDQPDQLVQAAAPWEKPEQHAAAPWEQPEQPAAAPWEQPEQAAAARWEQPGQLATAPWEQPEQQAAVPWEQHDQSAHSAVPWEQSEHPVPTTALFEQPRQQAAAPWEQHGQQAVPLSEQAERPSPAAAPWGEPEAPVAPQQQPRPQAWQPAATAFAPPAAGAAWQPSGAAHVTAAPESFFDSLDAGGSRAAFEQAAAVPFQSTHSGSAWDMAVAAEERGAADAPLEPKPATEAAAAEALMTAELPPAFRPAPSAGSMPAAAPTAAAAPHRAAPLGEAMGPVGSLGAQAASVVQAVEPAAAQQPASLRGEQLALAQEHAAAPPLLHEQLPAWHPGAQAQAPTDYLDLESPRLAGPAAGMAGLSAQGFQHWEATAEAAAFSALDAAVPGTAAAVSQALPAAEPAEGGGAAPDGDGSAEQAADATAEAAQPSSDGQQLAESATWYDEAGNCWCQAADGWLYWWDAAAQQWQQHSQAASSQPADAGAEVQAEQHVVEAVQQQAEQSEALPVSPEEQQAAEQASDLATEVMQGLQPSAPWEAAPAGMSPAQPAAQQADVGPAQLDGAQLPPQEASGGDWADSFGLPVEEVQDEQAVTAAAQQELGQPQWPAQPAKELEQVAQQVAADYAPPTEWGPAVGRQQQDQKEEQQPWKAEAAVPQESAVPAESWQQMQERLGVQQGDALPEQQQQWQPAEQHQQVPGQPAEAQWQVPEQPADQQWHVTEQPVDQQWQVPEQPAVPQWQADEQPIEQEWEVVEQPLQQGFQPAEEPWQPALSVEAGQLQLQQPLHDQPQRWQPAAMVQAGEFSEHRPQDGQHWAHPANTLPVQASGGAYEMPSQPAFIVPSTAAGNATAAFQPAAAQQQQPAPTVFQPHARTQAAAGAAPSHPTSFMPAQPATEGLACSAPLPPAHPTPAAAFPIGGGFATFSHGQPAGAATAAAVGVYPSAYSASSVGTASGAYPLHGRPPAAFGKLLFGGRLLLVSPSGSLQLHALARAPAVLLQPLPGAPTTSLSAGLRLLESFPGPLSSSTSKDKVAKFCAEQADVEAPPTAAGGNCSAAAEAQRTLWLVLRVLAQHQGRISSAPYSFSGGSSGAGSSKQQDSSLLPESQLAAALLERRGADGDGGQLLLPAFTPATHAAAEAAAAEVQHLLLQGRRSDALRVAVDNHLWAVALLLSRLLGETATAATAAALAEQCLTGGSPLQALLLLLGGTSAEQPLRAAAAAAAAPQPAAAAAAAAPAAAGWQPPGVFNPAAAAATVSATAGSSDSWRRSLAMMAANRIPGDEAAFMQLGSRLLSAGQVLPAHICFVLAGALLQPWELAAASTAGDEAAAAPGKLPPPVPMPGNVSKSLAGQAQAGAAAPLVLLGVDAPGNPRSCCQLASILQTEVFTWSRTVGNTALAGQYLPVVPFKLLHAHALAELGLLQQASSYCASMNATLQAVAGKVPPGLLVCRAVTADLAERLQQYAAGQKLSLGSSFTGTLVSSVGKWLDRGLTAMLGGGSEAGSDAGRHSRRPSHSRNPSTSSMDGGKDAAHRRSASSGSLLAFGAHPDASATVATASGSASPPPPAPLDEAGKKGGSLFHRVTSITSLLRPKAGSTSPAPPSAAPSPPENVFYYDHELKMWRERGVEPPPPPEPVAPPPTTAPGGGCMPLMPPPGGAAPSFGRIAAGSVGSRYALAGSYGMQPAVPAASLVPQPGGFGIIAPAAWQPGAQPAASSSSHDGWTSGLAAEPAAQLTALVAAAIGERPLFQPALAPLAGQPGMHPADGLRIQHTRALSTDSTGSGPQPGMQFADAPSATSSAAMFAPHMPHSHLSHHPPPMPFVAEQPGEGFFSDVQL